MDWLPFPFAALLAGVFLTLLCFMLLLNIFGLPANWLILGLVALWKLCHPTAENLGLWFWLCVVGLALTGEVLEFLMQLFKARRYGSSSSGTFMGMVGAIIGAILLAPIFWGLGAFIGALLGAWLGCFGMELCKKRPLAEACQAACGAMLGRFFGTVVKCGIGVAIIAITAQRIWPDPTLPVPDAESMPQLVLLFFGWAC